MKTLDEVRERVEHARDDFEDSFMCQLCDGVHPLMAFIPEMYKEECKDECLDLTTENVIAQMQAYIDFAYEKAEGQRGISASRSMWRYKQWLWILEDTEIDCDDFCDYGISALGLISEKYNLTPEVTA